MSKRSDENTGEGCILTLLYIIPFFKNIKKLQRNKRLIKHLEQHTTQCQEPIQKTVKNLSKTVEEDTFYMKC